MQSTEYIIAKSSGIYFILNYGVTLRSRQIWGTPRVLASKELIGRPWALKIGLGGGPIGGTVGPTGQVDGTLTGHAKTLGEPHGK